MKIRCTQCGQEKKFSAFVNGSQACKVCTLDPWRERPCVICGTVFKPQANSPSVAAASVCCRYLCSKALTRQKREAARPPDWTPKRKKKGPALGESRGAMDGKLDPLDHIPCPRCSLRGHEPGDPERCLSSSPLVGATRGLGGQSWV